VAGGLAHARVEIDWETFLQFFEQWVDRKLQV
jgi:hypothetical protein